MSLLRPSGGLIYHLRARRERARWREFVAEIGAWLEDWPAQADELLLIGPSAGYTLPTGWLKRFGTIYAFDPDPFAPWLFKRNHPGVKVKFLRRELFWRGDRYRADEISDLAREYPQAAILFSNVLGQLPLEHPVEEEAWLVFLKDLRERLEGREWASYHDLYTHEGGEVIDHLLAGNWREGLSQRQFRWPLTRHSIHLVEGVRNKN